MRVVRRIEFEGPPELIKRLLKQSRKDTLKLNPKIITVVIDKVEEGGGEYIKIPAGRNRKWIKLR